MLQSQLLSGKTYCIQTFGCQMNFHDSERVSGLLESCGCNEVVEPADADIVVFMTCCVREKADTRLYGHVSSMASLPQPPSGKRVVCVGGCIAQRDGHALLEQLPIVDVVFGTSAISSLPHLIENALDDQGRDSVDIVEEDRGFSTDLPSKRADAFHAWVPIMSGCDNFCTYCIVPYVRGREKSRRFESIVQECEKLKGEGVREICLLGQNVNSYGKNIYGKPRFAELIKAVGETGIERLRFTSSNPYDLSDEVIEAMASTPSVMPHLHLAVQSGSNRILKAMNRHYTHESYLELVEKLKRAIPDIALTTDIIVGFPNEDEKDFEDTLELVRQAHFSSAFTFIYSKREGTPAAKIEDSTPKEIIQERFIRLTKLVEDEAYKANQRYLDTTVEVLVEGRSKSNKDVYVGHSKHNVTTHFSLPNTIDSSDIVGKIANVHVSLARTWYLQGELTGTLL